MLVAYATRPYRHLRPQKLQQLRHKSSVPGPLESRRRSAKRKYAGAASSLLHRSRSNDIIPLFGADSWIPEPPVHRGLPPPQLADASRADPQLPSWLTGALRDLELEQNDISHERLQEWKTNLGACRTTQDIELLGKSTNTRIGDSRISRLAFEHLCKVQSSIDDLLLFLNNRDVNPPAALNLAFLFSRKNLKASSERHGESWLSSFASRFPRWLKREISLGNLTEQEIRHIARSVASTGMQMSYITNIFQFRIISALAGGTLESRIRPPHHLQQSTIRCILRALTALTHLKTQKYTSKIASDVIQTASDGSSTHVASYNETYLRSFLRRYCNTGQYKHAWKTLTSTAGALDRVEFLALVGLDLASKTLTRPKAWLLHCLSQPEMISYLSPSIWNEHSEIHSLLAQCSPSVICTHLTKTLSPAAAVEFVLDHWVLPQLGTYQDNPVSWNDCSYATPEALKEAFRDYLKAHNSHIGLTPYLELFGLAKTISPGLAENVADRVLKLYANASNMAVLTLLTQHVRTQSIALDSQTATMIVNHIAFEYPLQALDLFLKEPSLRIENCLSLVAAIMTTSTIPNETILSLLSRTVFDIRNNASSAQQTEELTMSFVLALAEMLSKVECPATAKLALVSRVLELFDPHWGSRSAYMMHYALRGEIIGPLSRGDKVSVLARDKILTRVAKREGTYISRKLRGIIDIWQAMEAPLEGRYELRQDSDPRQR